MTAAVDKMHAQVAEVNEKNDFKKCMLKLFCWNEASDDEANNKPSVTVDVWAKLPVY